MKKLLTALLILALVIVPLNGNSISANTLGDDGLLLNPELDAYVDNIISVHLYSTENDFGDYVISKPFILKNVEEGISTVCYLVKLNNGINKILEVAKKDGKFYSTLSGFFANELQNYIKEIDMDGQLFTDGNYVIIENEMGKQTLYSYDKDVEMSSKLSSKLSVDQNSYILDSVKGVRNSTQLSSLSISYNGRPEPTNYRHLRVSPIRQESANWCWAACTAMGINYSTRYYVNQRDVVEYVYGRIIDAPGSARDVYDAYRNWGIRASINSSLYFRDVVSEIEADRPIILGLNTGRVGHMVIINGFDDWYGSDWSSDQVIRMIDPHDGSEISSTYLNDDRIRYNGAWKRCLENIVQ